MMCQFKNCNDDRTMVSVIYKGNKTHFCSIEHAALWLLVQEHPCATRIVITEDDFTVPLAAAVN